MSNYSEITHEEQEARRKERLKAAEQNLENALHALAVAKVNVRAAEDLIALYLPSQAPKPE